MIMDIHSQTDDAVPKFSPPITNSAGNESQAFVEALYSATRSDLFSAPTYPGAPRRQQRDAMPFIPKDANLLMRPPPEPNRFRQVPHVPSPIPTNTLPRNQKGPSEASCSGASGDDYTIANSGMRAEDSCAAVVRNLIT
jgi:hypothetical protein